MNPFVPVLVILYILLFLFRHQVTKFMLWLSMRGATPIQQVTLVQAAAYDPEQEHSIPKPPIPVPAADIPIKATADPSCCLKECPLDPDFACGPLRPPFCMRMPLSSSARPLDENLPSELMTPLVKTIELPLLPDKPTTSTEPQLLAIPVGVTETPVISDVSKSSLSALASPDIVVPPAPSAPPLFSWFLKPPAASAIQNDAASSSAQTASVQ